MTTDGRAAKRPYRVRVGTTWYWVDPTVPADDIEPGDTVIIYPVAGDAALAILQSPLAQDPVTLSSLEGDAFKIARAEIATLHLAAVDDEQ